MKLLARLLHYLGHPFRVLAAAFRFLVDLTPQQMRSVFSLAMIGGIITLSFQNIWYSYRAEASVAKDAEYHLFFGLLQKIVRFNSGLIGWFALIMGLVVFGADYFRAKWGDKEIGVGKGKDKAE